MRDLEYLTSYFRTLLSKRVDYNVDDICMVLGYHFETEIPRSRMILWFMVATGVLITSPSGVLLMMLMVQSDAKRVITHIFTITGRVFTETSNEFISRPVQI